MNPHIIRNVAELIKAVTTKAGVPVKPVIAANVSTKVYTIPTDPATPSILWGGITGNISGSNSGYSVNVVNTSAAVDVAVTANGCTYRAAHGGFCPTLGSARVAGEEINVSSEPFKAYPNPSEGTFVLETDGSEGEAYLISTLGQIIDTIKLTEGISVYSVSVSSKGSYLVRIKTTTANKSFKISIQ